MDIDWILVPGGTWTTHDQRSFTVRTLLWARTPVTRRQLGTPHPDGHGRHPATGLTHARAVRATQHLGGRLPTAAEWEWMAAGPERRRWPWGEQEWTPDHANLSPSDIGSTTPSSHTRPARHHTGSSTSQETCGNGPSTT
ncbi:SUMF1/EgtB/PvdO family nonheme iron enzyme [Actinosynnema sp. NPDC020468]|uniref:SUMF1/EgtB/PvdO family nonheme iron enzyme n=1 Tax=Actinosynnema sp. NPDC020468 TaxID=3154488 RepID=UPI0033F6C789